MNETKKDWVTRVVPSLAFTAGIIMAAIGGIMLISSSLKLTMFDAEPYTIITEEECKYDYTVVSAAPDNGPKTRTPEEMQTCLLRRETEERERFQNSKKENIIDGISALLVGGILILAFRKRK
jgi:hypothetical protein